MTNISEKILLGIIFIVLVGFNSVFILGQQNTVYNEKLESPQEINEEQAKEIALNVVNGVIKEVEERTVNGVSFYEVEIEDDTLETELKISKDGNIFQITQEEKDEEISQEELKELKASEDLLTEEKIIGIALKLINGRFISLEVEREGGKLIYGIKIDSNGETAEVEVDAKTGEVLEIEWGDD